VFKSNNSITDLKISFKNPLQNRRRISFIEEDSRRRTVTFNNIYNSNFLLFLSNFLPLRKNIINLKLSRNELNKNNFNKLFIFILNELKSLQSLDLSNNSIDDDLIIEIIDYLRNNPILKSLNLEKNLIFEQFIVTTLTKLSKININSLKALF
jgi:hypothetical protein